MQKHIIGIFFYAKAATANLGVYFILYMSELDS